MSDRREQIIRQHAQAKRRELIERAVMQRTPVGRPISCATSDAEAWLISAMMGSRTVVAAVCGRLIPEDWTNDRMRDLFLLFSAVSSGDGKADAVLSEALAKCPLKSFGASPGEVVLACGRLRKARRQRLVYEWSERLFIDGDEREWLSLARRAIAEIEAIQDVVPLKGEK